MRRMYAGVAGGLLAALVLVGVAVTSYRAGMGHDAARVVEDGEVVRVVGMPHWGPPFGFFFLLFLGLVLFALFARGRGPCGPWALGDWHRRAHTEAGPAGPGREDVAREDDPRGR